MLRAAQSTENKPTIIGRADNDGGADIEFTYGNG